MPLSDLIRKTLDASRYEGDKLYPPQGMDRNDYKEVNDFLERFGGKWKSGKVKAHVFDGDAKAILTEALAADVLPPKNPLAFSPTPESVAFEMQGHAFLPCPDWINGNLNILEPSAGEGAIIDTILYELEGRGWFGEPHAAARIRIDALELDPKRAAKLEAKYADRVGIVRVTETDFLTYLPAEGKDYDFIYMNPPFSTDEDKTAWIRHFNHAFGMLTPGGKMCCIAPASVEFREDKAHEYVRRLIQMYGYTCAIDDSAFKESGTNIRTTLIYVERPEEQEPQPRTLELPAPEPDRKGQLALF